MSDPIAAIHKIQQDEYSRVPLSAYQLFVRKRYRLEDEFDISVNHDRMNFLLWYLSNYTKMRQPMRVPLAAAQIRWLLESEDKTISEFSLPRIVDAYWRRSLAGQVNPYAGADQFRSVAFWWSVQLAPEMNIEHALIPDRFVALLSSLAPEYANQPVPASHFLMNYAGFNPGEFDCGTPVARLASYLKILLGKKGPFYSLFFPKQVLSFLDELAKNPENVAGIGFDLPNFGRELVMRLRVAKAYRERHKLARGGRIDLAASTKSDAHWEIGEEEDKFNKPILKRRSAKFANETAVGTPPAFLADYEVAIIGPTRSQSGLGQATRMSIESLRAVGIEPALVDFYLDNPAPRILTPENRPADPNKKRINLIHLNAESLPLAPAFLKAEHMRDAINIGYFFWELPTPAPCHDLALDIVDEIWVSSQFNLDTYSAACDKPVVCTGIAVEPLPHLGDTDAASIRAQYDIPEDAFAMIATFDSYSFLTRKNPAGSVRAFQAAFGRDENVRLVLKTQNMSGVLGESSAARRIAELRELIEGDDRIILIDETLPFTDLIKLKSASDGYLSLHRSEGWGYGLIESMQLEKPVVATNFSGNLEFCKENTAMLVPWTKRHLKHNDYIFCSPEDYWAEPDIKVAAKMIRHLRDNPDFGKKMGKAAAKLVAEQFAPKAVGTRYVARLEEILKNRQATPAPARTAATATRPSTKKIVA